jgi:hypothetical protein
MKIVLLDTPDIIQTTIPIARDYQFVLSPQSQATDARLQYDYLIQRNYRKVMAKPAADLLKLLQDSRSICGMVIDRRSDFEPTLSLSPHSFAYIYGEHHRERLISSQRWNTFPLNTSITRIVGGQAAWVSDLGFGTIEEFVNDCRESDDLTKLLFSLVRERHALGFEDPTPLLFGVEQIQPVLN